MWVYCDWYLKILCCIVNTNAQYWRYCVLIFKSAQWIFFALVILMPSKPPICSLHIHTIHLSSLFLALFQEADCLGVFDHTQNQAWLPQHSSLHFWDLPPLRHYPILRWIALLCSASYATTPPLHIARTSYSNAVQLLDFATLNSQQTTSSATYSYFSLADTFNSFGSSQALAVSDWCQPSTGKAGPSPLWLYFSSFGLLIICSMGTSWWDVPKPWEHNRTSGHGPAIHEVSWNKPVFSSGLSAQLLTFQTAIMFSRKAPSCVREERRRAAAQAQHSP